jgi:hypothetical protein
VNPLKIAKTVNQNLISHGYNECLLLKLYFIGGSFAQESDL